MDKNTILAVVLSVIVISVGMTIQSVYFAPDPAEITEAPMMDETPVEEIALTPDSQVYVNSQLGYNSGVNGSFSPLNQNTQAVPFEFATDVFTIIFDPAGASVASIRTNEHMTDGEPVELLFRAEDDPNAFLLYPGNDKTHPIDAVFDYRVEGNRVIFSQDFKTEGTDEVFTITKTYTFGDTDYLFEINVDITNSANQALPLNFGNNAYTLAFEPQLGPKFDKLPQDAYSYRRFYMKKDGSKKKSKVKLKDGVYRTEDLLSWVALTGKYFSVIGIPDATNYEITMTDMDTEDEAVPHQNAIYFTRPATRAANLNDTYRFYIGPQQKKAMTIYNNAADNSFGASGLELQKALDSSSTLGWLEGILLFILNMFYKVIPNYGVGIILTTFLLKLILYPLTRKGMESSAKMSALQPRLEEIKKKYPDNPMKQNQETAELYKKEKISPLGGCLPMLIQFPILIAFYGLLNKHFEFRGAMFLPGWITDLSMPDTVFTFPFSIPVLGDQLHLLPIFYTVSMVFSMKITQSGQSNSQTEGMMKFMTFGMPFIFFFMLYNAPSGLMLYWSVMNLISIVQQTLTNKKQKREKLAKRV